MRHLPNSAFPCGSGVDIKPAFPPQSVCGEEYPKHGIGAWTQHGGFSREIRRQIAVGQPAVSLRFGPAERLSTPDSVGNARSSFVFQTHARLDPIPPRRMDVDVGVGLRHSEVRVADEVDACYRCRRWSRVADKQPQREQSGPHDCWDAQGEKRQP